MRLTSIDGYHQFYIQTIYDYFRDNDRWPTYKQLQEIILQSSEGKNEPRKLRIIHPDDPNLYSNPEDLDEKAKLSVSAIRHCENAQRDLDQFVRAINYFADKYLHTEVSKVEVSSTELRDKLLFPASSVRKVGFLLQNENIWSIFMRVDIEGNNWRGTLSKDIAVYGGVQTIENYLSRKTLEFKPTRRKVINPSEINDPAPIIEKVAHTDPANIQQTTANLMQIDNSYYINALNQSQRSFNWALIGGGVGVAFFIAAFFILIFRQPLSESYIAAIITASSGGVVEIIAGIILVLHSRASNQANQCHDRLNRMQRFLVAISHCENLEGDLKHTTRAELIKKLGDIQQ